MPGKKNSEVLELTRKHLTFAAGAGSITQLAEVEDSADGKKLFKMEANSGGIIHHWYWGNFAIDMTGIQIASQRLPALRQHDDDRIVGFTEKIAAAKSLTCEGVIVDVTEDGREVGALCDVDYPWQASVYIPPLKIERVLLGETAKVNGHTLHGPGTIFRKSELREVSFCTLGADQNTSAGKFSAQHEKMEVEVMSNGENLPVASNVPGESLQAAPVMQAAQFSTLRVEPVTAEQLKVSHPDSVSKLENAARVDAFAEGVKAERARIVAAFSEAAPMGLTEFAIGLVKDGTEAAELSGKLKDEKLSQLTAGAPVTPGANDEPAGEESTQLAAGVYDEAKLTAAFEKSAKLQEDFGTVGVYLAYEKANRNNRCRIQGADRK